MSVNLIRVSPHRIARRAGYSGPCLGYSHEEPERRDPDKRPVRVLRAEAAGAGAEERGLGGRPGRTGWTLSAPRLSERARRSLRLVVARLLARLLRHDSNAVGAVRAFREDVEAEPCEPQRPELAARPIEGRVPGSTAVGCRSRKPIRLGGVNSNR